MNLTPGELNDFLRNSVGPLLSASDFAVLAAELGISQARLAQASTTGDDYVPLFPDTLPSGDPLAWPMPARGQGDFLVYLQDGYREATTGGAGGDKTYKYRVEGPAEGAAEMREWGRTGNPFYDQKIRKGTLDKDADGWFISIEVANEYLDGDEAPEMDTCDLENPDAVGEE